MNQRLVDAADLRLKEEVGVRLTLDPNRAEASSLRELFDVLAPRVERSARSVLAHGLIATAEAVCVHFPDNIFWDFDAMLAAIVRRAPDAPRLDAAFEQVLELHARFGCQTPIRFRYIHDFVYGFDWAKWVRRDPRSRGAIGPFDAVFFEATLTRGTELLALIENNDAKYPQLPDGLDRNPFRFSREPQAEARLHRALVAEGLVPVEAWKLEPTPVWDRPFAELREARAARAQEARVGLGD